MKVPMNISLKSKMALAVSLLFILFSLAMTWFTLSYFHRRLGVVVTEQQANLASLIATSVNNRLAMARTAISGATAKATQRTVSTAGNARDYLNSRPTLQAIFDDGIYFFDAGGRFIAESSYMRRHSPEEIQQVEQLVSQTAATGKVAFSSYRFPSGTRGVLISVPVVDGTGKTYAIMAGGMDLHGRNFVEEMSRIRVGATGYLYIYDTARNMIIHQNRTSPLQTLPQGAISLLKGGTGGTGITYDSQLGPMMTSFQSLDQTGWFIATNMPQAEAYKPLVEARKFFLLATVSGTLALLLLTWFLMRRFMEPLQQMIRHIAAAAGRPEKERYCTIDSDDEIGTLATAFNGMVADLQNQTAELEVANSELKAFGYSLSHDLKTPLTRVSLAAQALTEMYGDKLDDSGRFCIDSIEEGSRRMDEMIDGMLLLSGISRSDLNIRKVNLSTKAKQIAQRLQAEEPERRVEWSIEPTTPVSGDPRLLKSVLENLLGNSLKYTGKTVTPRIEFGSLPHGTGVAFFVRDNGAGFDPAYAEKIFRPFQRVHDDEAFKGSGIGLATVQRIIQRHGGKIWAEGTPGEGAAFYFTLPPAE